MWLYNSFLVLLGQIIGNFFLLFFILPIALILQAGYIGLNLRTLDNTIMATRAIIKVEGVGNCALYKHWDGYPINTLPWLEKFNKDFTEKRGIDPSYKMAQLIRSSVKMAEEFGLDDSDFTGWGIVGRNDDMGQEFEYLLKADGTVTHKSVNPFES